MSKNVDLRVIKTKRLIKESFLSLIDDKGFEATTINDISDKAQINRSTFYLHYTDKYELLNKLTDDVLSELNILVCPEYHIHEGQISIEAFKNNILSLLETVVANALFYKAILGSNGIPNVRMKIIDCFTKNLEASIVNDTLIPRDLFLELTSSIYVDAISWWIINDLKYSPAFMADYLANFLSLGAVKVANSKDILFK